MHARLTPKVLNNLVRLEKESPYGGAPLVVQLVGTASRADWADALATLAERPSLAPLASYLASRLPPPGPPPATPPVVMGETAFEEDDIGRGIKP